VARALAASMRVELPRPAATKAPIYEGSNFSLWLLRFETWAKVQGLWAFFRGAVPRPTEPTNANAASFQDLQAAMQRVAPRQQGGPRVRGAGLGHGEAGQPPYHHGVPRA